MGSRYECDRCGACCKHGPVDLYAVDLLREPRLDEHALLYRKTEPDGRVGYLLPAPEIGCPLLDEQDCCSIHATRPSVCAALAPGSEECQNARLANGLEPLRKTSINPHVSPTPREESAAMTRQNDNVRTTERNGNGRSKSQRNGDQSGNDGNEKRRPVHEVRMGRIKAAVWENATENGTRHNVTLSRIYKDGEQWKDTASFGRDDLPLVAKVADLAHTWIFEQTAE